MAARRSRCWKCWMRSARRERIKPWVDSALARGERLMGFGHRVYRVRDPRADVLKGAIERLAGDGTDLPFAGEVEAYIRERVAEEKSGAPARHQCGVLHRDPARRAENPAAGVYADLCGGARRRLDRACPRAAARRPADPAEFGVYRADAGVSRGKRVSRGLRCRPCERGIHNHRRSLVRKPSTAYKSRRRGVWVPAFAGRREASYAPRTTVFR